MASRPLTLRATIAISIAAICGLAVATCAGLVLLTPLLHSTTRTAADSVESVHLAEEAEVVLLLHGRAMDPLVRTSLERDLFRRLDDAGEYVASRDEQLLLDGARARVAAYFEAARRETGVVDTISEQGRAFAALEELVVLNVSQARSGSERAAAWDAIANVAGIGGAASVLVIGGAILFWLYRRAFHPVLSLMAAIDRYGKGDRAARADELGPDDLRQMNHRFNEMADIIDSQRQAQVAFLGGVAHDLRGPLMAQRLTVSLLRRELGDSARTSEMLERLDGTVRRLERMVGDFLDISKIEAGHLDMLVTRNDAGAIAEEVVAQYEEPGHPIALHVVESAPIDCDRMRLEQALGNLVSNAIKYSPTGTPIDVVVEANAFDVVVSVTDRGPGISTEDQEKLFEPFRRVGLSQGNVPGVGLGLHIVKRIVEAHGGRIEVRSELGSGSSFRIVLPRSDGPSERGVDGAHDERPPP